MGDYKTQGDSNNNTIVKSKEKVKLELPAPAQDSMGSQYTEENSRFVVRKFSDFEFKVEVTAQCRGGPLTTLKALAGSIDQGMEGEGDQTRVKDYVTNALVEVGATPQFCEFFADALQCEHDMTMTIYKLQQALRFDRRKPPKPKKLLKAVQDITKSFSQWQRTVDELVNKGKDVPSLRVNWDNLKKSKILKALCSIETKDIELVEGDALTITDSSQPNKLKVMNSKGVEAFVPALCCVLPTPDRNALNAAERLRVQLLASWTESVKKTQSLLLDSLSGCVRLLAAEWKGSSQVMTDTSKERVAKRFRRILDTVKTQSQGVDLNKLHTTLFSLEREITSFNINGTDISGMVETVADLDKSVLCHQMLHKQWMIYRRSLEREKHPIRIIDGMDDLKMARPGKCYKYFEVKMTLENVETVEEILYINNQLGMSDHRGDQWTVECGERKESVKADQITQHSQEENKRFFIKAVVDPRTKEDISIKDAISIGIVNREAGVYMNPDTGDYTTIQEAMSKELIKVEYVSTRKTAEKTTAIGLIRIKRHVDNRPYSIANVTDSFTGEIISFEESKKRGIIDEEDGFYIIGATGEKITLDSAIDNNWVTPDFGPEATQPEIEIKTYAIHSVVDQRLRKKVPFLDAVKRNLIDKDTGNYINNVTREHIYVADAIQRGFLKAKEVDSSVGLDISAENTVVVERIDKIRKNVLKPIGVIQAMKKLAAGEKNNNKSENNGGENGEVPAAENGV